MKRLVHLKDKDERFYVESKIIFEFDIPVGIWVGVEDNVVYNPDDLIFLPID